MKLSNKLDLILQSLYKNDYNDNYQSVREICEREHIPFESYTELMRLTKRLETDGYIKAYYTQADIDVILTSHGIEYCEEDSSTYKGHSSTITNNNSLIITNSPNANIISNSNNVNIQVNSDESNIKNKINEIKEAINQDYSVQNNTRQDIIDCIEELETIIDAGKKPRSTFEHLLDLTSKFAGIGSLILELGKLIPGIG